MCVFAVRVKGESRLHACTHIYRYIHNNNKFDSYIYIIIIIDNIFFSEFFVGLLVVVCVVTAAAAADCFLVSSLLPLSGWVDGGSDGGDDDDFLAGWPLSFFGISAVAVDIFLCCWLCVCT